MTNLQKFTYIFENWVLSDIQLLLKLRDSHGKRLEPDRTTYDDVHRPFISAVILVCCAIDCLAGFRYGRGNQEEIIGKCFREFIQDYFPSGYNSEKVYSGIRNATVHCYSAKGVGFSHTDKQRHLAIENSMVVIDVFCFYEDLGKAYEKFKAELLSGLHTVSFNSQTRAYPIIEWIEDRNIKKS